MTCTADLELGNSESAACILASAAKVIISCSAFSSALTVTVQYEEALRNMDDPDGHYVHARARVTTVYFSSRMEAVRLLYSVDLAR